MKLGRTFFNKLHDVLYIEMESERTSNVKTFCKVPEK